jgi:hypothetical protein
MSRSACNLRPCCEPVLRSQFAAGLAMGHMQSMQYRVKSSPRGPDWAMLRVQHLMMARPQHDSSTRTVSHAPTHWAKVRESTQVSKCDNAGGHISQAAHSLAQGLCPGVRVAPSTLGTPLGFSKHPPTS